MVELLGHFRVRERCIDVELVETPLPKSTAANTASSRRRALIFKPGFRIHRHGHARWLFFAYLREAAPWELPS
jgi:hypothetical protein